MWLLKKITEEGPIQYLVSDKKVYTVGRKNTDIVLPDNSISRTHCMLHVAARNECPFTVNTLTGVWVVDKKSKYGTFVQKNQEWVKIEGEAVEQLINGSIIRFGLLENIWRLEYKPVIACSSRLSNTQTEEMKRLLSTIDGRLLSKWVKQCNVVFVNDITLTVKVLLALIDGVPIVTTNYLTKLVECVKQNQCWPDYKHFRPEIKESTLISHLVSLNVEDHRKDLFKGKTFIIPTKEQLDALREIIEAAGGRVELLKLNGNWRMLADENIIVIQLPCDKIINPDERATSFKNMASVLKNEYQTRVIPETEIFQAIAYSSTEKYCCPRSEAFDLIQCSYNNYSHGDVIEEETPTQNNIKDLLDGKIGNDRKEDGFYIKERDRSLNRKRKHSPEPEEVQKKLIAGECRPTSTMSHLSERNHTPSGNVFMQSENCQPTIESHPGILSNRKQESSEVLSEPYVAGNKIGPKSLKENLQSKLSEFWREPEKKNKTEVEKRKLNKNENDSTAKRRCTTTDSNISAVADNSLERVLSSDMESNVSSESSKQIQKPIKVLTDDETIGIIRWKEEPNTAFDGSFGQRKSCKKFKKREQVKVEETKYTAHEYQALRQLLLNDGWTEYRRKAEITVN